VAANRANLRTWKRSNEFCWVLTRWSPGRSGPSLSIFSPPARGRQAASRCQIHHVRAFGCEGRWYSGVRFGDCRSNRHDPRHNHVVQGRWRNALPIGSGAHGPQPWNSNRERLKRNCLKRPCWRGRLFDFQRTAVRARCELTHHHARCSRCGLHAHVHNVVAFAS
jgi:hypothetical protein